MKPNVNAIDRLIRFLAGTLGIVLLLTSLVSGFTAYLVGAASLILLVTAAVKFCPFYKLIGITTHRP